MTTVSIAGLDKARVLQALYAHAQPQGMGILHYRPGPLTDDEARALLGNGTCFDYVAGRVMKVELHEDELDTTFYDRDNGPGAGAAVIEALRESLAAQEGSAA